MKTLYVMIQEPENGLVEDRQAGIYDVCEWLVDSYPEDVFVSSDHPVHIMRDKAKEVLALRKRED